MTPVFLDTVGLVAVWEHAGQWHAAASGVFRTLLLARVPCMTTPHVLLECGNASARRPCRADVALLRPDLMVAGRLIVRKKTTPGPPTDGARPVKPGSSTMPRSS